MLNIKTLHNLSQKPPLYEPGEPIFWNDPHISKMMLEVHLDPDTNAASHRPEIIEARVNWLLEQLGATPNTTWLDIGCGPGLYTSRLAQRGLHVTGIDFSENSLAYARSYAAKHNLDINYRFQNYLTLEDEAQYDVVSLIAGDLCPLTPAERSTLLERVGRALKPDGRFVFDVSTPVHHLRHALNPDWAAVPGSGFYRPEAYLVLDRGFVYPDDIFLKQHIVIMEDGSYKIYRFWYQDYTLDRITEELAAHGFVVDMHWGDLTGAPHNPDDDEWLAIVARRV